MLAVGCGKLRSETAETSVARYRRCENAGVDKSVALATKFNDTLVTIALFVANFANSLMS